MYIYIYIYAHTHTYLPGHAGEWFILLLFTHGAPTKKPTERKTHRNREERFVLHGPTCWICGAKIKNTAFYSYFARFMNTVTLNMYMFLSVTGFTRRNTFLILVWLRPRNTWIPIQHRVSPINQNPQRATHEHKRSHIPAPPHGQQTLLREAGLGGCERIAQALPVPSFLGCVGVPVLVRGVRHSPRRVPVVL